MIGSRLPLFIAIPLATAFVLPVFGRKGKAVATLLANLATIALLVLSIGAIGQSADNDGLWTMSNLNKLHFVFLTRKLLQICSCF